MKKAGLALAVVRSAALVAAIASGSNALAGEKCPLVWRADSDSYPMTGWSTRESDAGGPFRWTVDRDATIQLPRCEGAKSLRVTMAYSVSDSNLKEVRIAANGAPIATTLEPGKEHTLVGSLPAESQSDGPVTITFTVPKLDEIAGSPRRFGVSVRAIEMR